RGKGIVRAPAHQGELVPELHIGRPDIVEELDLDHRLEPAGGEPDGPPDDVGLGEGRVVYPIAPEGALQSPGDLEDAALALDVPQILFPAAIGHILPEQDDSWIPHHLIAET